MHRQFDRRKQAAQFRRSATWPENVDLYRKLLQEDAQFMIFSVTFRRDEQGIHSRFQSIGDEILRLEHFTGEGHRPLAARSQIRR